MCQKWKCFLGQGFHWSHIQPFIFTGMLEAQLTPHPLPVQFRKERLGSCGPFGFDFPMISPGTRNTGGRKSEWNCGLSGFQPLLNILEEDSPHCLYHVCSKRWSGHYRSINSERSALGEVLQFYQGRKAPHWKTYYPPLCALSTRNGEASPRQRQPPFPYHPALNTWGHPSSH